MPESGGVFRMPSLGADMDSGTVLEWLVHPGDTVHRGDLVAVVKTDKADIEVEIFEDGVIGELLVPEGDRGRGRDTARDARRRGGRAAGRRPRRAGSDRARDAGRRRGAAGAHHRRAAAGAAGRAARRRRPARGAGRALAPADGARRGVAVRAPAAPPSSASTSMR